MASTEIVGVWSAEALYGLGGESDEILVINRDGSGWLEVIDYDGHEWSADFFEWGPTEPGWFYFAWTKRIEPHKQTRALIESASVLDTVHASAEVREEAAPSGRTMKILYLPLSQERDEYDAYGLVSPDPGIRAAPTGQRIASR